MSTMTPINSSQILGARYDAVTQELHIEFPKSGVYVYQGVPEDVANGLFIAESAGKYLHAAIKPVYGGLRPDGTAFDPTPAKASKPKAEPTATEAAPTPALMPGIDGVIALETKSATPAPAAKATTVPVQADEPYTHEHLVADLQAANVLLAGFVPVSLTTPQDLEWLAGALEACDDNLVRLQAEYDAAADEVVALRNALRRYYEPQARKITEQIVATLGGARKSIDTPIPGRPGEAMRWSLTTQPARLQLDDPDAAKAWAKKFCPSAITEVPERTIPASEALNSGAVVEAWKAASTDGPAPAPEGFVLIPESQKFSYKPVAGKEG